MKAINVSCVNVPTILYTSHLKITTVHAADLGITKAYNCKRLISVLWVMCEFICVFVKSVVRLQFVFCRCDTDETAFKGLNLNFSRSNLRKMLLCSVRQTHFFLNDSSFECVSENRTLCNMLFPQVNTKRSTPLCKKTFIFRKSKYFLLHQSKKTPVNYEI